MGDRAVEVHLRPDQPNRLFPGPEVRQPPEDASARLTDWTRWACASTVLQLERFVGGIQKDVAAALGASTSPWRNGQVEGQVTGVKLLQRQMSGRTMFDFLRTRILLA